MLAQTLTDWEIIVVDDHSTDATVAMVHSYTARDDRIRLLQTPSNGGPSVARNVGFAAARGTWIAILDSDDRFRPERLQRMVEHGEAAGSDIVSDNPVIVTSDDPAGSNMFTAAAMAAAHRVGLEEFILGNISKRDEPRVAFGFMKPILKAAFLRDNGISYDELMRFSEDFVFYITCLQHGARWDYVPQGMYLYTIRPDSLSESSVRHSRELVRLYEFSRALAHSEAAQGGPRYPARRDHLLRESSPLVQLPRPHGRAERPPIRRRRIASLSLARRDRRRARRSDGASPRPWPVRPRARCPASAPRIG